MFFRKECNEIFKTIIDAGMQPTDFQHTNGENFRLDYKRGGFQSIIKPEMSYFTFNTYPKVPGIRGGALQSWQGCLESCGMWIAFIQNEEQTPDLWAEAQANSKLFALNPTVPNEMFNAVELRQLEGQVRQLVQGLAALALPAHAQKLLTQTVQEIPEKASRFTKKELEGWFMGAFISQVTNLALSPEHVAAIGHLIKTTFMGLLQLH